MWKHQFDDLAEHQREEPVLSIGPPGKILLWALLTPDPTGWLLYRAEGTHLDGPILPKLSDYL